MGQNFIFDTGFLNSVLDKLEIAPTDTVIEIGTGAGTLTTCIAARAQNVITYEVDKTLTPKLPANVQMIYRDILTVDTFPEDFILVANIPYYITTPIIMKFLKTPTCRRICILIQDDVAKRIVAPTGTKEYGALSATVQAQATARIIKKAPRGLFRPVPNVDSAFVVIEKNGAILPPNFDKVIKDIFSKRRKKMSSIVNFELLAASTIYPDDRPENVTPDQFVKLCQTIARFDGKMKL